MSDATDITNAKSASTATFVTALVFNAAVFGIQLGVFTILRPFFKAIYEPRTYVPPPEKRVAPLTPVPGGSDKSISKSSRFISGLFWPISLFYADYRPIIKANGLDAFFFVRFLRLMVKLLLPIWIISWVILLPATSVGIQRDPDQLANEEVNGVDGLSRFTFGNVGKTQQQRYWAHLVCAWIFTLWVLYNLKKEMSFFIVTRQQHLTEKTHSRSVQANTILVTGIPDAYLNQYRLRELFKDLPGGVKRIWINRNLRDLPEIYDRRLAACNKLESAETALMRTAAKLKLKADKQKAKGKATEPEPAVNVDDGTTKGKNKTTTGMNGSGSSLAVDSPLVTPSTTQEHRLTRAEELVPQAQRPTHKLGFLGLWGEKVDTIDWCRKEIAECTKLLEEGRAKIRASDEREAIAMGNENLLAGAAVDEYGNPIEAPSRVKTFSGDGTLNVGGVVKDVSGKVVGGMKGAVGGVKDASGKVVSGMKDVSGKMVEGVMGKGHDDEYVPLNSAFVTFNKQISAHLAVQALAHHKPYRMSSRYVEVAPSDVIWSNLGLNPYEQKIRMAISYAATAGLILLWAFPVAFVGAVSNINKLCTEVSWLAWICDLPEVVVGIISGILPPVLLAVLMMLLPIILRLLARFEGIPKYTGLELSLMTRFFLFQVLHSFLIVTLSSGIIASLEELANNPTSIPAVLAENLPKASTFFLTYVVLQGLSGAAGGFLQIVSLIIYYVKLFILGSTPRSVYNIKYTPGHVAWGTLFPGITLLTVITLAYSTIAPIINGLAILTFFLFYQLYKYLFLWVFQQDLRADTGGLFFPKAIQHVFVGLYLEEICLAALFFLARDENNNASSIPQGALMVVLIVITAGFHAILNNSYGPLLVALPLSLKDRLGQGVDVEDQDGDTSLTGEDDAAGKAADSPQPVKLPATSNTDAESAIPAEERELVRQGLIVSEEPRLRPPDMVSPSMSAGADGSPEGGVSKADQKVSKKQAKAEENELNKYGFAHPAASRPQRTIWIPTDELGIAVEEVEATRRAGVDISCRDAAMNYKGKVDVSGPPPGYSGL
ncbi:hypothetical protein CC1G_14420 [Coprinopsis cinerea okayama7|uniref:DUF221-domain-containing protein n=1 Tax=Coprinopsis cinerea (strain Okayama-7 / 130 / ATCC MYA-4618 / FGSC 9003) TaxID=240176 RepID=D6RM31_COPC7|nr:hypothetical protein CC1G_14420 [Coprinopsis cinerea okayama7\|eukprot:XP_002911423.1 hypothetical protein CC1G_14420 [Coprinopsis cinerea okayama7\